MSDQEDGILQNAETSAIVDQEEFYSEIKKYYSNHNLNSKKVEWSTERIQKVIEIINGYNIAKSEGRKPTNSQYHHANKYSIIEVDKEKVLVPKKRNTSDPVPQIIPTEDYYDKIFVAHITTGHGRRDKIVNTLRHQYVIPIFAIQIFINLCKICVSKKAASKKNTTVVKPLVSEEYNKRGQIDIIDFQTSPDDGYKWLLQYQDISTKFSFLRPLKTNRAKEVAIEVLKIFLEVGCPFILQSDSGRQFTASLIKEIVNLWPSCKIVNGSSSQGSKKCSTEDVKKMILTWMVDNKSTCWSLGCHFVQLQKNSSYDSTIGRTPFKALFGVNPTLGLSSTGLPKDVISQLELEEDMEKALDKNEKERRTKNDSKTNDHEDKPVTGNEIFLNEHTKVDNEQAIIPTVSEEINNADHVKSDPISTISEIPTSNTTYLEIDIKLEKVLENDDQEVTSEEDTSTHFKNTNILPIYNIPLKMEDNQTLTCNICDKEVSVAHSCMICKKVIHAICGTVSEDAEGYFSNLVCNLCLSKRKVDSKQSQISSKRPAYETATSSKKLKESNVNFPVLIELPKVSGPLVNTNVITNSLERENGLYIVGTAAEIFKNMSPQNAALSNPGQVRQVTLAAGAAASISSPPSGKVKKKCYCRVKTRSCDTKRCPCKKSNNSCNSKCHSPLVCKNM